MPESKTIDIDEITSPKDSQSSPKSRRTSEKRSSSTFNPTPSLGWKALLTLKITQWFIFLKSKSYGKWIIGIAVILAILLIIPLSLIAIIWFSIKSLFRPNPRR